MKDRVEILDFIASEAEKWQSRAESHCRAALAARLAGDIATAEAEDREAVVCALRRAEFGELARMAGDCGYDEELWEAFDTLRGNEPRLEAYDRAMLAHRASFATETAAGISGAPSLSAATGAGSERTTMRWERERPGAAKVGQTWMQATPARLRKARVVVTTADEVVVRVDSQNKNLTWPREAFERSWTLVEDA